MPRAMEDAWRHIAFDRVGGARARRLAVGILTGAACVSLFGLAAAFLVNDPTPPPEKKKKEKIVDVSLVDEPEGGSGSPEPAVAALPVTPAVAPPPLVQPKLITTSRTSNTMYDDPKPNPGKGTGTGTGSGSGTGSGAGVGTADFPVPPPPSPTISVAPPPPPPPAPKAPPKPNPADYDPPKCKRRGIDPGQAKAIGVEGKVIVSYTVTATGAVTNVKAVSGPPELMGLAVQAVSGWSCEPARMKSDGSAIQITKKVPLTVTLK